MKKYCISTFTLFLFLTLMISQSVYGENPTKFDQPLMITSAGQSAEVQLASVLAKRAGLTYSLLQTATVQNLTDVKTIALVIGASLKGLGAAGLDMTQEKERVSSLIQAAQEKNISILCLHLGGEQRRGAQSDELISAFLPFAQMAIVVQSGNKDGLFSSICDAKGIPLVEVERTVDALEPLKSAFK